VDIDGTISDVVPVPEDAVVRPGCQLALRTLAGRLAAVVVVTGRDVRTARRMVALDTVVYFGNHGLERWDRGAIAVAPEADGYPQRIKEMARLLEERLPLPGVYVEEKGLGISIHYRNAADTSGAEASIGNVIEEVGASQWLEPRQGKMLVDLRLRIAVNKGTVVRSIAREHGLWGAVVIGDDTTDVDAFRAARDLSTESDFTSVNVAVVGDETPDALLRETTHTLAGVSEVEAFLTWLTEQT
jgi:trehalose 6-phosphate phosphatase